MKKILLFIIPLFFILTNVYARGPANHLYDSIILFQTSNDPIVQQCKNYQDAWDAGCELSDITITDYNGVAYKILHNPNYAGNLMALANTPKKQCLAYSTVVCHFGPDYVSHNLDIPPLIYHYQIPNMPLHIIFEGDLETNIIKDHPEAVRRAEHALDILDSRNSKFDPELLKMVEDAMSKSNLNLDVEAKIQTLHDNVDFFYKNLYFVGATYKPIADLVTATMPMEDYDRLFVQRDVDVMKDMMANWVTWSTKYPEPAGFTKLTAADMSVNSLFYGFLKIPTMDEFSDSAEIALSLIRIGIIFVIIFVIIVIILFVRRRLRKRRLR